jgi:hypothetical protein
MPNGIYIYFAILPLCHFQTLINADNKKEVHAFFFALQNRNENEKQQLKNLPINM